MNRTIIVLMIIFCFMPIGAHCQDSAYNTMSEQYKSSEFNAVRDFVDKAARGEISTVVPGFRFDDAISAATSGKFSIKLTDILSAIGDLFIKEIKDNIHLMTEILVLAILTGLILSFSKQGSADAARYTCYLVVSGILVSGFSTVTRLAYGTIDSMLVFMQIIIPSFMGLLLSTGSVASVTAFQPMLYTMVGLIGFLVKTVIMPMITLMLVMAVVDGVSEYFQISKMRELAVNICKWCMAVVFTIFVGMLAVLGTVTTSIDGVTSKLLKQTVSNAVPVVGSVLADSADTVIGYMGIVRNGIGVVGLITIIILCTIPIIKVLVINIIYRLTAAVAEPVADKRICDLIFSVANVYSYITTVLIGVGVIFMISIAILIGVGNITLMYR